MSSSPKAVRSRSRSGSRSPLLARSHSKVRLVGDLAGAHDERPTPTASNGAAMISPRSFNPIAAGRRILNVSPRKIVRKAPKEESILSKYLSQMLPAKLSALLSVVMLAVAAALFYGERDGHKLVKRDAALKPGDRLAGGQYVSSCTSFLTTSCKPKYFEVGRDGSVGVYAGRGPHAPKGKLWSANTGSSKDLGGAAYELVYSSGKVILNKDGKMKWSSPIKSLPKNMQPWPFAP